MTGVFLPDRGLPAGPRLSQAQAHEAALEWMKDHERLLLNRRDVAVATRIRQPLQGEAPVVQTADVKVTADAVLYYVPEGASLTWILEIGDGSSFNQRVGVDAMSGAVLFNNDTATYAGVGGN